MQPKIISALQKYLLALADDELVLAHRNSEWIGHAPILEEDIAIANIAQDELGHAGRWYEILRQLTGDDPDHLVFFRDAPEFRNAQMVELPKGDWAFTMLRQYLFDVYEMFMLAQLAQSSYPPLAETAVKLRNEELYHVRHTRAWVRRLGLGTAESLGRMQNALHQLWPYTQQLFIPLAGETALVQDGIVGEKKALSAAWLEHVRRHLADSGLEIPEANNPAVTSRTEHTGHLSQLLADLQLVARLDPAAAW